MHNFHFSFSPTSCLATLAGGLLVTYFALVAVVMSYAALTVEFSQQERNDEAAVATLESQYLAQIASVTTADYTALGYAKPSAELFVSGAPATALR